MKTVLVIEDQDTSERIIQHLTPLGFDFIHYLNPVKALDNIDEINPDLVLFSAEDFPRHWKPFIRLLRGKQNKEESVFILLTGDNFSTEEASKASVLEVNGMVDSQLKDEAIQHLQDIFARYNFLSEPRSDKRYPGAWTEGLDFAFTHPRSYALITGAITDISLGGLNFNPDMPQATADIMEGEEIKGCSLSIGDKTFQIDIKIIRNSRQMAIHFIEIESACHTALMEYLNETRYRQTG
ncbi:MAG: PilZ domain-containing protein [Spirochaetia bacterium]|nr:PilZ domain-containing protein [Spirochaetia bacterium]